MKVLPSPFDDLTIVELDDKQTFIYLKSDEQYVNPTNPDNKLLTWSDCPDFRPHNWHNYVPEEIKAEWFNFTILQRILLGKHFQILADNEEWD